MSPSPEAVGSGAFAGSPPEVAARLLGMRIVTRVGGALTSALICEVEVYGGADDPASHAFGGVRVRNRSMFASAGTLYVYRSYGIHWCANVVTGPRGQGEAVLLRGGLPERGVEAMVARRGREDHLCNGPGKLTKALGIDGSHDGLSLSGGEEVWLEKSGLGEVKWTATPRVGITKAVRRPWRLLATGVGYRSPRGMNRPH